MPETDRKINYSLRPQKAMERRMLCDLLKMLNPTFEISKYSYVGMGAKYFTDFLLFHRELGISQMTSIEADKDNRKKYDFNIPLKCIDMYYGMVQEYIDAYEDDGIPKLFWMDYDYSINQSMLDDCKKLVNKLKSGDIFFVSFNSTILNRRKSETLKEHYAAVEKKFKKIKEGLGDYAPTREITLLELADNLKRDTVFVEVIRNMVETQLQTRNEGGENLSLFQLACFSYADGADMVTWGGMVVDNDDEKKLRELLKGNSLPFFEKVILSDERIGVMSENIEPYDLRIPLLTYREFMALQKEFPTDEVSKIDVAGFNESELKQLSRLYRYYSPYMEAVMLN